MKQEKDIIKEIVDEAQKTMSEEDKEAENGLRNYHKITKSSTILIFLMCAEANNQIATINALVPSFSKSAEWAKLYNEAQNVTKGTEQLIRNVCDRYVDFVECTKSSFLSEIEEDDSLNIFTQFTNAGKELESRVLSTTTVINHIQKFIDKNGEKFVDRKNVETQK